MYIYSTNADAAIQRHSRQQIGVIMFFRDCSAVYRTNSICQKNYRKWYYNSVDHSLQVSKINIWSKPEGLTSDMDVFSCSIVLLSNIVALFRFISVNGMVSANQYETVLVLDVKKKTPKKIWYG